jgi:ribosomal protein S12 methylthiotransferase
VAGRYGGALAAAGADPNIPTMTYGALPRSAAELAAAQNGRTLRVLVDQARIARSAHDAPDVDCRVVLSRDGPVGEFANVRVTGSHVYDLLAEPLC